jgi:hypothetical protein
VGNTGADLTPEVQTALWQCYLPAAALQGLVPLSDFLAKSRSAIPRSLLGIAVWNLVLSCEDHSIESPPALVDLLHWILELDVDAAVQMRQERPTALLPTFPDLIVFDSQYEPQTSKDGEQATVQICVPSDFDVAKQLVQPSHWADRCCLWSRIGEAQAALKLSLPTTEPRTTQLKNPTHQDGPLEAKLDVDIDAQGLLKLCHGQLTVKKEEGRPGAVRLINQKTVSFAHPPLDQYAAETLKYWLATEAVSLVTPA